MSQALRAVLRHVYEGLVAVGYGWALMVPPPHEGERPLPGHPERLVPHVAPDLTEQRLWAQLGWDR
jgi:hypothetical protein